MGIFSGKNSTFNIFVERTKDGWDIAREFQVGKLNHNAS